MKILCIGDMHFKFELSYSSFFKDGRRQEWEDVKKTIIDASKKCDQIVFLGDQFNSRHNHSSVIREFMDFLNDFGDKEIHLLAGNHERYSTFTALDFLEKTGKENIKVYKEPSATLIGGRMAFMIPFVTPALLGKETLEESTKFIMSFITSIASKNKDLLFAHHAVSGSKNIEFFNEIILSKEILSEKIGLTFSGHVHQKEILSKNVVVAGSTFPSSVGEHQKSIFIIDTEDNSFEEVALPCRGIYKITLPEDFKKIDSIPKNSIVKCIVTDKKVDKDEIKNILKRFDAYVLVEQYQLERKKVEITNAGMDLSIDSLLKLYAEETNVEYSELKEGFELIK